LAPPPPSFPLFLHLSLSLSVFVAAGKSTHIFFIKNKEVEMSHIIWTTFSFS
jgi:hypothetical protein